MGASATTFGVAVGTAFAVGAAEQAGSYAWTALVGKRGALGATRGVMGRRGGRRVASNDDVASALRGFVRAVRRHTEGKFNIVVIKQTVKHDASGIMDTLEEVEEISPHPEYGTYMVYIFGKGTFVNKGDGGFHNICCSGKYSHSSGRYKFQEI